MRGSHHNTALAAMVQDLCPYARLAFLVHGRHRLIKQPEWSWHDKQTRERQPAALTMRKKLRRQVAQLTEANRFKGACDVFRTAIVPTKKPQIFRERELSFYAILMPKPSYLRNTFFRVGDSALGIHAKTYAALWNLEESGDGAQQRGLASTIRAMHGKDLPRSHGKADFRLKKTSASCERQSVYDEVRYCRHRSVHMLTAID